MTKFLTALVPALALSFATLHCTEAQAAHHVRPAPVTHVAPVSLKVFIPAHFELVAGRLIWVAGTYRVAPHAHAVWVPGHWEHHHGRKVWIAGSWR